jgi:hypothetical protein
MNWPSLAFDRPPLGPLTWPGPFSPRSAATAIVVQYLAGRRPDYRGNIPVRYRQSAATCPLGIWRNAGQWLAGRPRHEHPSDARLERLKSRNWAATTALLDEERFTWESSTAASSLTSEPLDSIPAAGEAPSAAAPDSSSTMDVSLEQDESNSGRLLKAVRSAQRVGK